MNPLVTYSINNFEELIRELERINRPEYLFELEDRIIEEITLITHSQEKEVARAKLLFIKKTILGKVESKPHFTMIIKGFQNSIEGAVNSALYCL